MPALKQQRPELISLLQPRSGLVSDLTLMLSTCPADRAGRHREQCETRQQRLRAGPCRVFLERFDQSYVSPFRLLRVTLPACN